MFYDRTLDHRINRVQERALRIAYKDYGSVFGLLLEQTKSVPIHVRNLQLLMTEMYKTKSDLNPPFMKDIFMERNISYNLRHGSDAQLPKVRTTSFGIETTVYLGNKLWQLIPQDIKKSSTLPIFKKRIRCWNGDECNCRLCKTYIPKVGFLKAQTFDRPSRGGRGRLAAVAVLGLYGGGLFCFYLVKYMYNTFM